MIARLYTFTAGSAILAAQINGEYDQIVQLLSGIKLDTTLLKNNAALTLAVDNTGANVLAEFRVAGAAKARVNAAGQYESLHTTGTAPLVVASTTVVSNLNADTVDGKHAADLLTSLNPQIANVGVTMAALEFTGSGGSVFLTNISGTSFTLTGGGGSLLQFTLSSKQADFNGVVTGPSAPTAASHLTRKDYVDTQITAVRANAANDANIVTGLSGGTNNKVVRWSSGSTWADADFGDSAAALDGLLIKGSDGKYYRPGAVVPMTGLTAGSAYFLYQGAGSPNLTTAAANVVGVAGKCVVMVGRALSTTSMLFVPSRPVQQ